MNTIIQKKKPINLKIKGYHYGKLYNETSDEDYGDYDDYEEEEYADLSDMPPLEGDEKKGERQKGLNVFTPKKLLTRVPILLAQIKFGNK